MATYPAQKITAGPSPAERISRLLGWTLATLAGAYLIGVLVQFSRIVANTYLSADAASAPVIGQLYDLAPAHRDVVLGKMAWYSTLMFELATRWLPLHREIWETAPYAMALASAALIGWGLWRVAGRTAAIVGGVVVVCASPHALGLLFWLNDHSPTWFTLSLLAGLLVLVEDRGERLRNVWAIPAVIVVGLILGANGASDTLLIAAGAVPALLAVAVVSARPGVRVRRRALWLMAAMLAVAIASYAFTRVLMHHEDVTVPGGITQSGLASGEAIATNFKLWWQSIAVLGNGNFFGQQLGFTTGLELVSGILSLIAVVVLVPRISWRETTAAFSGGGSNTGEEGVSAARTAWCVFWGSSAVLLSISFIASATPEGIESSRYLIALIYAAAALVPLLLNRGAIIRITVLAAAGVFSVTGLVALLQGTETRNVGNYPSTHVAGQIAALAKREHLTIGYAGYWDATPVTWASHFRVQVYPVQVCGDNRLCIFPFHIISSWYLPRPGIRSFLLYDPTQPLSSPPVPTLGTPSATYTIDGYLTMYVFPYDIASRLAP